MAYVFCPLCAARLTPIPSGNDAGRSGCPEGHFVDYANPAVTTFAYIEQDGLYLALRRAHPPLVGGWDLPGGFVEAGEYPDDAVQREIEEETGLRVADLRVFGAWTGQYGEGGKWTVDIAYRCRVVGGEMTLSTEKSEFGWYTLDAFPEPAFNSERIALDVLRG
jgi:8-oxo-dGTP diphosphatase